MWLTAGVNATTAGGVYLATLALPPTGAIAGDVTPDTVTSGVTSAATPGGDTHVIVPSVNDSSVQSRPSIVTFTAEGCEPKLAPTIVTTSPP